MNLFGHLVLLLCFFAISIPSYSKHVIEFGTVEGRVVDEATQIPLGNAYVLMTWELRVLTFPQSRSGGYVYVAKTLTDSEGNFRLAPSNPIDLAKFTQNVELGDAHVWLLLEGYRTKIDKVSYRIIKKGIPLISQTDHAVVDNKLLISINRSLNSRAEFFDIAAMLRIGKFHEDKNACNDPVLGGFIYRAVKRQSQLRSHVSDLPKHLFKQIDCNGSEFSFYPYSG